MSAMSLIDQQTPCYHSLSESTVTAFCPNAGSERLDQELIQTSGLPQIITKRFVCLNDDRVQNSEKRLID